METADSEVELTDEEAAELLDRLFEIVEKAKERRKAAEETQIASMALPAELESPTEREQALFEILKATVFELEEVKRRMDTIEDLFLLKYRSKNTRSH